MPKKVKKDPTLPVVLPIIEDEADKELNDSLHPHLPKAPSVICIYASFRSGKTVLVNNFILNPNFLRGKLDQIYYYSPTIRNDPSGKYLADEEGVQIIDEYSEDHLNALLDFQMESKAAGEADKIAVIFDDAIQYLQSRKSSGNHLATKFRHFNIKYLFYVSQSFRALDTKVRANCKGVIIMKISNLKELEKIDEEYGGLLGGRFFDLYNYCLNDQPYSFMYINIDANPVQCFLRFERQIFPSPEFPPSAKYAHMFKETTEEKVEEKI